MPSNNSDSLDELERAIDEITGPSETPPKPSPSTEPTPQKTSTPPASIPPVPSEDTFTHSEMQESPSIQKRPTQYVTPDTEMLSTKEIAELPLFMRVEKYDEIIKKLTIVVHSLNKMDDILQKLSDLDKQRNEEMRNWLALFRDTKLQLKETLTVMPETGKIEQILKTKKRSEAKEGIKEEIELLKEGLEPSKEDEIEEEIGGLKHNLKNLQNELKSINSELKKFGSSQNITKPTEKSKSNKKSSGSQKTKKNSKYTKKKQEEPW